MKKIISILCALAMILISAASASAVDFGCDVDTESSAVYMENLDTGIVVLDKNASERMYPASTTKVMTYIIVAENIPDFSSATVEITESALLDLDPESSVMGLSDHIGETVSVLDLLYGLMLPSGNDAALVLADYVGHGVDLFVDMMNRKAAQLGCKDTHFVSPHGMYDERHYSTAGDMAIITKYALSKDMFKEITSSTRHTVTSYSNSPDEVIKTTNYLIDNSQKDGYYYYPYANGIKTGFTDEAGRCLISTAEKDGYRYLIVALGAEYSYIDEINYAMLDSRDLYEWAFSSLSYQKVYEAEGVVRTVSVEYYWGDKSVDLVTVDDITALLPENYSEDKIKTEIDCVGVVTAPVEKGDKFGTVTVYYDNEKIGSTDIVAAESVGRHITNYLAHRIFDKIVENFPIFLVMIVIVIALIIVARAVRRRRRIERRKARYR